MDWIGQIALATLLVGLFAWLRADQAALRRELRADIQELWAGIQKQGQEVAGLRERMARVEGLLEGLRDAVTGRQAA